MYSLSAQGYLSYNERITPKGRPLFTHYLNVYCIVCMFHNVQTPMETDGTVPQQTRACTPDKLYCTVQDVYLLQHILFHCGFYQ